MPPEQIDGGIGFDERTDVFALAVVTWQALTGSNPFLAKGAEESRRRIAKGPGRLARLAPGVDPAVEATLARELSPAPSARDADALELAEELVPHLGLPAMGAESLRGLVEQAEKDDEPDAGARVRRERAGGSLHLPEGAAARAATALLAFSALRLVTPHIPWLVGGAAAVAPLAGALAGAAWPPSAAPLAMAAVVAALLGTWAIRRCRGSSPRCSPSAGSRGGQSSGAASASPPRRCCSRVAPPVPRLRVRARGLCADPVPAALTSCLGYLTGCVFHASVSASSRPTRWSRPWARSFPTRRSGCCSRGPSAAARSPRPWRCAGRSRPVSWGSTWAWGVSSSPPSSQLAWRIAGIWAALDWPTLVLALLLFVLMCIATVLRGPLYEGTEGEELDEFPE